MLCTRRCRVPAFALTALLAAGCAGSTAAPRVATDRSQVRIDTQERTFELQTRHDTFVDTHPLATDADRAWAAVGRTFAELEMDPTVARSDARLMGVENLRLRRLDGQRMNYYFDCGNTVAGPIAALYDVYLTVLTQVEPVGTENSELQLRVEAHARDAAHSNSSVRCTSRGRLERRLLDTVEDQLARAG